MKNIIKFVVFNKSPFQSYLWYLDALLYVSIIGKLFNKFKLKKVLYIITPFLLIVNLVFGKYSIALLVREIPYLFVRNFLFVGIPYFCIGMIIFQNKDNIITKFKNKNW